MGSKLAHGLPGFGVSAVLHEPTRRLRAEVDAGGEDKGRDKCRAKFKTPGNLADILENDIGAKAEEDTNCDPELPEHDKGTTDAGRGHLSRVNRNSGVLGSDADAHNKACCEEALPRLGETRSNRGRYQAAGSDEDLSSSSEVVIQGVDNKGANEASCEKDDGVDNSNGPGFIFNAKLLGERQVGTIGTSLIPTLGGSTNGTKTNGIPKHHWAMPLVILFVLQSLALLLAQLGQAGEAVTVSCDEGSATKEFGMLSQVMFLSVSSSFGNHSLG